MRLWQALTRHEFLDDSTADRLLSLLAGIAIFVQRHQEIGQAPSATSNQG
jgi:hypothetical protein